VAKGLEESSWEGPWRSTKSIEVQRGDWCLYREEWTRRDQLVSIPEEDIN
jgi:hypothetical protein